MLHGRWGEGGPLQAHLETRGIPFVGCRSHAASLCIDKHRTKLRLREHHLPTPDSELLLPGQSPTLGPPAVVKAVDEGSSLGLTICHTADALGHAAADLLVRYDRVLVERFVPGAEVTVGILEQERELDRLQPLPPILIQPAAAYYDFAAKYTRDDTPLPLRPAAGVGGARRVNRLRAMATAAHRALGCRHLSRVDFIVDDDARPWLLEVNTMPGFTSHSLLPMAAREAGLDLPTICTRLARLALADHATPAQRDGARQAATR